MYNVVLVSGVQQSDSVVCVYIYIYIYTHTHIYIHIYIHIYMYRFFFEFFSIIDYYKILNYSSLC